MQYVQARDDKSIETIARIVRMYEWTRIKQKKDWEEGKALERALEILGDKYLFLQSM